MLNLYCVNVFKGEILEGQMYVTAATREDVVKLATEGLNLIPVRIESDLKEVYPVSKEILQKEYDTPKYKDGFILSDNYKIEIRKFKDDDDEIAEKEYKEFISDEGYYYTFPPFEDWCGYVPSFNRTENNK